MSSQASSYSRTPTPSPKPYHRSSSRSPTPKQSSRKSSRHSSRTSTQSSRKYKLEDQNQSSSLLSGLDYYDYVIIFFIFLFSFAFFTVDSSNIDVKNEELRKLDYKTGLERFYLILVCILLLVIVLKKRFLNAK